MPKLKTVVATGADVLTWGFVAVMIGIGLAAIT